MLVCSRINHRGTSPSRFHLQMLPFIEQHTALPGCCCQTEGSLGRCIGTRQAWQAAPLNCSFIGKWVLSELACPSFTGFLPPKQMGTNLSMPGNEHAHQVGTPDKRFVSCTWCHPVQTAQAHCCAVERLHRNYPQMLILESIIKESWT